ncbi:TPA: hypothetical protein DEP96_01590 [Candidatus Uhrbacteria bacterium]|nr:hypothetical protein [Candidatus Uhrbacteria bacterium]
MSTILRFKSFSFRRQDTPYDSTDHRLYTAVVNIKDVPAELEDWRKLNVRDPKMSKTVPREISDSLSKEPESFFFKNRGLLVLAESVTHDNKTGLVEVEFSDNMMSGLADGGHTNRAIRRYVDSRTTEEQNEIQAYVKIEFLEGFKSREEVAPIIEARNNSTPVAEQGFQDLLGAYEVIKEKLKDKDYKDRIFYKQYEEFQDGTPKDIDIRDILSYLLCFDTESYKGNSHPIIAYSSLSATVEHFAIDKDNPNKKERLDRLAPLLPEILDLHDAIYLALPDEYNASGGKFGLLRGVTPVAGRMSVEELPFTGKTSKYRITSGFIYPILASFRPLVEIKDGKATWKIEPQVVFDRLKNELVVMIGEQAKKIGNPNQLGKDKSIWSNCYLRVENEMFRMNQEERNT